MATSVVPATIDALVTVLDAAKPADVSLHDGPPVVNVKRQWIAVGHSPTDGLTAVDAWTQEPRGLGQMGREERFDIVCAAGVSTGGTDFSRLRPEVFALLAVVESALRSNPELTDAVRFAEFTTGTFTQGIAEDDEGRGHGIVAGVEFRITCSARI